MVLISAKLKSLIRLHLITLVVFCLFILGSFKGQCETISIFYSFSTPQHEFAANDIKKALEDKGVPVELFELSNLDNEYTEKKIVIALQSNTQVVSMLTNQKGGNIPKLKEQAYAIRTTQKPAMTYWVIGGDDNGAMYGALQIAENFNFNGYTQVYNEQDSPHLLNRGIKFNIPFDKSAPTYYYSTDGSSHFEAINHVWDMSFWTTWFDEMARHRYNVLSLWSPHPFTSMLNMEKEYPGIAIQGVTGYDVNGNEIKINDMTIDQKVEFWQKVMKYGKDRGFDTYFCVWNIFLTTAEGMHGLTHAPDNELTKAYLKKCMINFLETYPDLAGFGITVGERMGEIDHKQKEEWAWDTYGMGMKEYAEANPDRELVFIHRQHDGELKDILEYFTPLDKLTNVRFDLSFKYSQAHAHTTTTPSSWTDKKMEEGLGANNLMSWLTIRNDDFYFLHWADPNYVRDYINHFPEVNKYVNAFYIGPDGWVFSRVFTNKDPYYEDKNALSIQKTWYMEKLWGRISYNPSVSDNLFKSHLKFKYPEVNSEQLFNAWSNASGALQIANEQVTGDWDLDMDWWPEGWTGDGWNNNGRFFSVQETQKATPYKGSKLCSFSKTAAGKCSNKTSAWETADVIEKMARSSLSGISGMDEGLNKDLNLNIKNIEAMANLSMYNAYKYRSAIYLEMGKSNEALEAIGLAYCYWKKYTDIMDSLYIGVKMQRNVDFENWHEHDKDALQDYLNLGGKGEPNCFE